MKVFTLATEWNVHYRVVRVEIEKLLKLFNTTEATPKGYGGLG